jgi:hypothetical protein
MTFDVYFIQSLIPQVNDHWEVDNIQACRNASKKFDHDIYVFRKLVCDASLFFCSADMGTIFDACLFLEYSLTAFLNIQNDATFLRIARRRRK